MMRIIQDRKEKNQLPKQFERFVGMKGKNFPTVRSVVSPSASTSLVIEADYKTAEMVALAYITGDSVLLKLLEEPDECFARVKPECVPEGIDPGDCVVRLSFPPYITAPPDRDKYLMTYTSDGVTHAAFTEDQLLRDAAGKVVSPAYDSHWGVLEISRGCCREILNKKKDRGAGKVANFCLAKDTDILCRCRLDYATEHRAIQDVKDGDFVWDGNAWVQCKGAEYRGEKLVMTYDVRATPDHVVYTTDGPMTLLDAWFSGAKLIDPTQPGDGEILYAAGRWPIFVPPTKERSVGDVPGGLPAATLRARQEELRAVFSALAALPLPVEKLTVKLQDQPYHLSKELELRKEATYDILDAGPNHRFTTEGALVANSSSYGGTAGSIARKIEQDTGEKVTEEAAQGLLLAIEKRQPRATEWFKEQENLPKTDTKIVAASGRIRHLHTISSGATDVSSRTREGVITALGRECRNFPIQERVGSSASRACVNIVDLCMRHPELKGYPGVCLYDSIVIFAPFNERRLWAKILQLYMSTADGWVCPGRRILRFGVDTESITIGSIEE